MAASVCFKQSSTFKWKIDNPFSCRYLETGVFSFDGSQWKLSLGYSNMLDSFPFILRKINREGILSTFEFELFIQSDNKELKRVAADDFRVLDCSPTTLWLPNRNYVRQLCKFIVADQVVWTFVFVLTSTTPRPAIEETACDCYERYRSYVEETFLPRKGVKSCKVSEPKSEDPTLACFETLTQDLHRMLEEGALSDVKLVCGELTIPAHRNILSARSEVFAAMLRSDMTENRTGNIEITDMEVHVFNQFVYFIYTSKFLDLSMDTAPELYIAGDKYAIDSLKSRCSAFIKENLTEENACNILVLADIYNDTDLRDCAIAFILQNELPQKDDIWVPFCEQYPKLGIEVFRLAYKDKCNLK